MHGAAGFKPILYSFKIESELNKTFLSNTTQPLDHKTTEIQNQMLW